MSKFENPLLTTDEVAEYLGCTKSFVRRTLRYEVPVVQHMARGPLRFLRSDIDRWIAANTRVPAR